MNDPSLHLLEAEHEKPSQLCLLLHGFTVLVYPWREVMPPGRGGRYFLARL